MNTTRSSLCPPRRASRHAFVAAALVLSPLCLFARIDSPKDSKATPISELANTGAPDVPKLSLPQFVIETAAPFVAPADPYAAYLSAVAAQWPVAAPAAGSLGSLLQEQATLALALGRAADADQATLIARLESVNQRMRAAQSELDAALAAVRAAIPPAPKVTYPPLNAKDVLRARRAARANPVTVVLPWCNLEVPEVAAPAAELDYLAYLEMRATKSEFAHTFVTNIRNRLDDRRELALRFLRADVSARPALTLAIEAVTSSIHASERGIVEALILASDQSAGS